LTLTRLLDGNLLVALVVPEHAHHAAAHRWFGGPTPDQPRQFATCPTVQGTLLRLLVRQGSSRVSGAPGWRLWTADWQSPPRT